MAYKLIALTVDELGTSRVYMGGETGPSSMVMVHQSASLYQRVAINPLDPLKAVAAGPDVLAYTSDGGSSWNTTVLSGADIRNLQWIDANKLGICTKGGVQTSLDGGATVGSLVGTSLGLETLDAYFVTDQEFFFISQFISGPHTSHLYHTLNGGGAIEDAVISDSPSWNSVECVRRIVPETVIGPTRYFLLLTSHNLYRMTHTHPSSLPGLTPLWGHELVTLTNFPSYPPTGWDGAVDVNNRYDDLQYVFNRIWMGGYNGLRAHSFDGTGFYLTDIGGVNAMGDPLSIQTHSQGTSAEVFVGSSLLSSTLYPYRPGLNFSVNGGLTTNSYLLFPGQQRLMHHALASEETTSGCSDPDACNYQEGMDRDDNSCAHAIQIRDCLNNEIIHVDNPEIVALGCRSGRVAIEVQALDPAQNAQSLQLFVNGVLAFSFSSAILNTGLPLDRIEEFIESLIAYINTTQYRAVRIPAGDNPITPGSDRAIWVTAAFPTQVGQPCSIIASNLIGAAVEPNMDNGSSGAVVSIVQYPGRCFIVCGQGNCALVQNVDLLSVFPDCSSCKTRPNGRLCMDCSSQVYVGDRALTPNGMPSAPNCVKQGDVLDIFLRTTFPDRGQEIFGVTYGGICGNCPVEFGLTGDKTSFFPPNSLFTADPDGDQYTVASSVYDSANDITVITTASCIQGQTK